jgi:hypothetical protein
MESLLRWIPPCCAGAPLARRLLDVWFRGQARRHVVELDQQAIDRAQYRTLFGLIHQAQLTRFGCDHDFRRIRTVADFRRLVPVRTPAALWREYGQPVFPNMAGATWPGPMPYLAIPDLESAGPFPCVPVSPALRRSHAAAAFSALSLANQARPEARLFSGRLLLVGDEMAPDPGADPASAGSLEGIVARSLPRALHPYLLTPLSVIDLEPADRPAAFAREAARQAVTCVVGAGDRLLRFFDQLRDVTGRERVGDVWPGLAAVFYRRGPRQAPQQELARRIGPGPLLLEACFHPEGAVAVEDPRHGRLRLLPDHGVYFEFVPLDQLGKPYPDRFGAGEVKPDVPYALALTSPAGLWSCLVGTTVRFDKCHPPLLRVEELVLPQEPPPRPAPPAKSARVPQPAAAFPRVMPTPLPFPLVRVPR